MKSKSRSLQVCRMEHIDAAASLSAVSSLTSIGVEKHNYLLKRVKQHQAQLRMICMQDFHIPFSFFCLLPLSCLLSAVITAEETPGYPKKNRKELFDETKSCKKKSRLKNSKKASLSQKIKPPASCPVLDPHVSLTKTTSCPYTGPLYSPGITGICNVQTKDTLSLKIRYGWSCNKTK